MTRDAALTAHVVLGTLALLIGPVALLAPAAVRGRAGDAYQLAVAGVAGSAGILATTAMSRLWWLLPIAVATEAAALLGRRARRRRGAHWPAATAHLLGGSYIALVTGLLVVETGQAVFWVLPALVGQLPIAVAKRRLADPGSPLRSA